MLERKKDEAENLLTAVRELQSQSFEQQKIGKLYYVVMLSRWQEAASNKKYTMVLTENKELRRDVLNMEARETEQEQGRQNCEAALRRKTLLLEHVKQQMSSKTNQYLSIEKAEELQKIIAEIQDDKHELEDVYFRMSTEFSTLTLDLDSAHLQAESARDMLAALKRERPSELSDRLIRMSEQQQEIRLAEMKATREMEELKAKHSYLQKLLKQRND